MKFAYLIEPPFNFVTDTGAVTGCDVVLARYVFDVLGLGAFEPVETEFAALLPGLADGRWRMTTGLFATEERRSQARFSRPIWALPDGLLVRQGNPRGLTGYASVADQPGVTLAVIRDQFQHRSAVAFGVPEERIVVFETYIQAAQSVWEGRVDAYASVARAHSGFIAQSPDRGLDVIQVPEHEKPPAFGAFAFGLGDSALVREVDDVLAGFLGTPAHLDMVAPFGFSAADIALVAS